MEQFFFGDNSHRLFGVLNKPSGRAHTGLVICPPFGEEMVSTYARFARWSKELADRGFAVMRYHALGTGESDGKSTDFTVASAAQDAATAVKWLRENGKVGRVGLFGLRFGATTAVHADAHADFVILWSPVVKLPTYCRDLLRLRITKDLIHLKADRVKVTAKDLAAELEAGRSIDLLGYEMSPALYRQLNSTTAWPDEPPAPDVLWLTLPTEQTQAEPLAKVWKDRGCRAEVQAFRERIFWEDFSSDFPHQFAETSIAWMEQRAAQPVGAR
jgi:exosortase A-associated hydrolase 2